MRDRPPFDLTAPPSGTGCQECLATGGWWLHLRRCAHCSHVGCCDSSPSQHASRHAADRGHPVVQSFEPYETWFWDYELLDLVAGARLHPPRCHPRSQPVPGPADRLPPDWVDQLH